MIEVEKAKIRLDFLKPVLGTVPKSKEVYKTFIVGKLREEHKAGRITKEEMEDREADELQSIEEREETGWTGFQENSKGLFFYDRWIKGHLKAAGVALETQVPGVSKWTIKGLVNRAVHLADWHIPLMRGGKQVQKIDGVEDRPLRAETMRGDRVCLVRSDRLDTPLYCEFELRVIPQKISKGGKFNMETVKALLAYGEFCGLGQFRTAGYGQFRVSYSE